MKLWNTFKRILHPVGYSIWDAMKDLASGKLRLASRATRTNRRNICNTCEVRNVKLNTCTACGCYIPAKTALSKSTCPMELW